MNYTALWQQHEELSTEEQKQVGKSVTGDLQIDVTTFLTHLFMLIDTNEIKIDEPVTMLRQDVFASLSEEKQDSVYRDLLQIARFIRLINDMRLEHGDMNSIHFQTSVAQLKAMVDRIEINNDVFKF